MINLEEMNCKIFDLFRNHWAIVTAGTLDHFNSCTVSWGSLGTFWTGPGLSGNMATVYIHPARYTHEFMRSSDYFTVSFFPERCKKAMQIIGSRSGRDGDKVAEAGLTPVAMGRSVGYQEASFTLLCRTLYKYPFVKEGLNPAIADYYKSLPGPYPVDENGDWQPHWIFTGDIIETFGSLDEL